jgi:hypothetical protein
MADKIFVSYSHGDMAAAQHLKAALAERGNEVWLAGDELRPGERWAETIHERLHAADVVILLIGNEPSRTARNEWSLALQESWNREDPIRLIPLLLPGAEPPSFVDVQAMRVGEQPGGWEHVAELIEAPEQPSFEWTTTDSARSELAHRLDLVEEAAAIFPADTDATS